MLDSVNVGGYRPVTPAQAVRSAESGETEKAAASTRETRDVSTLSGKAQNTMLSAESILARLQEMGVLERSSRPLNIDKLFFQGDTVTLTIRLADQTQPEASAEEWRPYLPPSAQQNTALISEDGQTITLTLPLESLTKGTALLEVGDLAVPLEGDGALLAAFADGTVRSLVLNQDGLDLLFQLGLAETAIGGPTTPTPADQDAALTDTPQAPVEAETESLPRPASAAPSLQQAEEATLPSRREEIPSLPLTERAVPVRVPAPPADPEGIEEWGIMKAVSEAFEKITEQWEHRQSAPALPAPEGRAQLQELRQTWVEQLRDKDPAAFRAWLQVHVGEQADQARLDTSILPRTFSRSEYREWMEYGILDYAQEEGESLGSRWLRSHLSRLLPEQTARELHVRTAAPLSDDTLQTVLRRFGENMQLILAGRYRNRTRKHAEELDTPEQPQRGKGELDDAWLRRKIAFEVDAAWTSNLKEWLRHVDGWKIEPSERYVNAKTNVWTTGLMNDRPAWFRQWLGSSLRRSASTGWFNEATLSFPIETLPSGFTDEDFRRWIRLDVLDYL